MAYTYFWVRRTGAQGCCRLSATARGSPPRSRLIRCCLGDRCLVFLWLRKERSPSPHPQLPFFSRNECSPRTPFGLDSVCCSILRSGEVGISPRQPPAARHSRVDTAETHPVADLLFRWDDKAHAGASQSIAEHGLRGSASGHHGRRAERGFRARFERALRAACCETLRQRFEVITACSTSASR